MLQQHAGKKSNNSALFNEYSHIDAKYLYKTSSEIYKKYKSFLENMTKEETNCIAHYNGVDYIEINNILRNRKYQEITLHSLFMKFATNKFNEKRVSVNKDKLKQIQEYYSNFVDQYTLMINKPISSINILDSIFDKLIPQTLSYPLFRGIPRVIPNLKNKKVGDEVTFSEYLSTSLSPSTAWSFQDCGSKPCCIFVFTLQKNIPFIPIYVDSDHKSSNFQSEHEILLPRGIVWKITRKYKTSIDINQTITCSYSDIENSKRKLINVYQMEISKYDKPLVIKPIKNLSRAMTINSLELDE